MNTQQAYEDIRSYFNKPGAKLAKINSTCKYLTETGDKCAVGCLIPAEMYDARMEGGGYTILTEKFPIIAGYFWNVNTKFLRAAQHLHDSQARDAQNFIALLDVLAFGLKLDVVGGTSIHDILTSND